MHAGNDVEPGPPPGLEPGASPWDMQSARMMFGVATHQLAEAASAGSDLLLAQYIRHHFSAQRRKQHLQQPTYEWAREQHSKMLHALMWVLENPYLEQYLAEWGAEQGAQEGMLRGLLGDAEHMEQHAEHMEPLEGDGIPALTTESTETAEVATPLVNRNSPTSTPPGRHSPTSTPPGRPWNPPTVMTPSTWNPQAQPTTAETQIGAEVPTAEDDDDDQWADALEHLIKDEYWHQERGTLEELEQRRPGLQSLAMATALWRQSLENKRMARNIVEHLEEVRITRIQAALSRRRSRSLPRMEL